MKYATISASQIGPIRVAEREVHQGRAEHDVQGGHGVATSHGQRTGRHDEKRDRPAVVRAPCRLGLGGEVGDHHEEDRQRGRHQAVDDQVSPPLFRIGPYMCCDHAASVGAAPATRHPAGVGVRCTPPGVGVDACGQRGASSGMRSPGKRWKE